MLTPSSWVGLCLLTESDRPHEWNTLAWVIRFRYEANREKQFGGQDYSRIVTHPFQFSAFNGITGTPQEVWERVFNLKPRSVGLLRRATEVAEDVMRDSLRHSPLDTRTYFFWSPRSMVPEGSLPKWNWTQLRRFAVNEIDPWRFLFAAEI